MLDCASFCETCSKRWFFRPTCDEVDVRYMNPERVRNLQKDLAAGVNT